MKKQPIIINIKYLIKELIIEQGAQISNNESLSEKVCEAKNPLNEMIQIALKKAIKSSKELDNIFLESRAKQD